MEAAIEDKYFFYIFTYRSLLATKRFHVLGSVGTGELIVDFIHDTNCNDLVDDDFCPKLFSSTSHYS